MVMPGEFIFDPSQASKIGRSTLDRRPDAEKEDAKDDRIRDRDNREHDAGEESAR